MNLTLIILGVLALVGIAIALLMKALIRRSNQTPGFRVLSPVNSDESVIAQLKLAGSDTSKVTDIIHYLYIPNKSDATAAASALTLDGYRTEVSAPLGQLSNGSISKEWCVVANIDQVPSIENISAAGRIFNRLATQYHGYYDGWAARHVN